MKTINITLLFVISVLFFVSCKKDSPVTDNGQTTITSTYYFKGALNGQAVTWQAEIDGSPGFYVGYSSVLSRYQGDVSGGLTGLLSAKGVLKPQLGIEFRTFMINNSQDITAYFNGYVNTGAWAYAVNNNYTPGTKALAIYYTDKAGKSYSSIGSQTGSSSNVMAVTRVPPRPGSNESLKIKLTFNCTLYPADGTGSNLPLTNAEATVLVTDDLY